VKIGELSAQTRRSVHSIRWYEAQGLIPGVLRDSAGRRIYHERHVAWLNLIERLRQTGMSIAQMRDYTALVRQGNQTSREQLQLLTEHRDHVTRTISEWTAARALIDHKIDFYRE
jgi:DNA-binding transcriptional MerR regulator